MLLLFVDLCAPRTGTENDLRVLVDWNCTPPERLRRFEPPFCPRQECKEHLRTTRGFRYGDQAPRAVIELVDRDESAKGAKDLARVAAEREADESEG